MIKLDIPRVGKFEFDDFKKLREAINNKDSALRLKLE